MNAPLIILGLLVIWCCANFFLMHRHLNRIDKE